MTRKHQAEVEKAVKRHPCPSEKAGLNALIEWMFVVVREVGVAVFTDILVAEGVPPAIARPVARLIMAAGEMMAVGVPKYVGRAIGAVIGKWLRSKGWLKGKKTSKTTRPKTTRRKGATARPPWWR